MAEHICEILLDKQDHIIDLATALGEEVLDLSKRGNSDRNLQQVAISTSVGLMVD